MKPLSIEEIVNAIGGKVIQKGNTAKITGVSTDTRTIQPGSLFIPLVGERFDGHKFIDIAVQNGAAAIITQDPEITISDSVHIIYTRSTLDALQRLATWYLKSFNIPVVAITGSTGKTTTKDMVYSVLSEKFNVLKTQGNFNNEIGLPLTLFNLNTQHQIVVLEMGMSGFGEIRRLVGIAPPKVAVISNIGVSHIEKLGSRENILKAKMEIFEGFNDGCTAIINDDNDLLHQLGNNSPFPVIKFGTEQTADYWAEDINLMGEAGIKYTIRLDEKTYPITLKVPGRHNIYNSLTAIAIGRIFGMDMAEIQKGLLSFESGKMRLNIFTVNPNIKIIDDVYNASPDSVNAALKILQDMDGDRRIAILGDMLELGEYSSNAHKQVGKMVVSCKTDILITKGKDSEWIGEGAISAGMPAGSIIHLQSNQEVIERLNTVLLSGDRILVKGSRGMHMEEIVGYLKNGRVSK